MNELTRLARYYRVSEDDIRKHLQARYHAGQKGRSHSKMNGTTMIQITETQARIFSKLISKIIDDYYGVNNPIALSLKVLRNEIDGKIAESELEQEQEKQNEKDCD